MATGDCKKLLLRSGHTVSLEREEKPGQWTVIAKDVIAIVQEAQPHTTAKYAAQQVTHRVYFADKLDVRIGDRIADADQHYLVQGVTDIGKRSALWALDCKEIKNGKSA